MKKNDSEKKIHLGENVKCLMRAFHLQQNELAEKAGYSESQLSNILRKADIDEETLARLAKGLGNGVTPEMIKAYSHDDTVSYIINNYTQNVENGGAGSLNGNHGNVHDSKFTEGSTQNNYAAEQAFEFLREVAELKTEIMRLRMKYEPDKVEEELKAKK